MGRKLARVLMITFMSKVEKSVLERMSALHCTLTNGCLILCPNQTVMVTRVDFLKQQSDEVKLAE